MSARGDDRQAGIAKAPDAAGERLAGGEVDAVSHARGHLAAQLPRLRARPDGELASRLIASHGVDQHDTGDLLRVGGREQAHQQPAVGVTDKHIGRVESGTAEQMLQVVDLVARVVHAPGSATLLPSPARS